LRSSPLMVPIVPLFYLGLNIVFKSLLIDK
jgi:hypothetical protein